MIDERLSELPAGNRLIACLPATTIERLVPHARRVPLEHKDILRRPLQPVKTVYFPLSGVISQMVEMEDGSVSEVLTVGREGIDGVDAVLGGSPGTQLSVVQAQGEAIAIPADEVRAAASEDRAFAQAVMAYALTVMNAMAQHSACNRLHDITERGARWLLMMHDRADGDEFTLLQEFLADMLGVRRPSVSVCAAILQRAGLIWYRRGKMRIVNRAGLEAAACECYAIVAQQYDSFFKDLEGARSVR